MRLRTIFSVVVAASLLLLSTPLRTAAQDFSGRKARAGLTIGPSFVPGASMILESPEGFKIKPVFAWRGGVHTSYPLTDAITAGLELGMDSRGTRRHQYNFSDLYYDTRVLYFSLFPNFTLSGFNLGFNVGFPLSASETDFTDKVTEDPGEGTPTLLELRLGANIPIYDGDLGWVALVVGGGYAFNEMIDNPSQVDMFGDWKNVSAHLGARFEFLIPGTERNK